MKLSVLDWSLIVLTALSLIGVVAFVKRYVRSVADFLSANRCAGRYMLTTAQGATAVGVVTYMANYETFYNAGFGAVWWAVMFMVPLLIIINLSGWVIYRYRETRAMTLAQFFEMRYTRRFRVFAGLICFISGVLNYGIFPQITANFFVHYCGLPDAFKLGAVEIPSHAAVMFIFLSIGVWLALSGGLLTVLIADFLQGTLMNFFVVALTGYLLIRIGVGNILETLLQAPAGQSMINPFDQSGIDSFTYVYFLMLIFMQIYSRGVWQGGNAANTSARTPHEARMAGILSQWRQTISYLLFLIVPLSAYVLMRSPEWGETAAGIQEQVSGLSDPQLRKQMLVPLAISQILPSGLLGLFAVLFFMAAVTTDDSYLHSWGSIFIQDVVLPLRKEPVSQKQHLILLRGSVLGVAVFAFFWSLWFPLKEYIAMYMQITGAIFLGGAGSVVIGGLYWRRGTAAGAWAAMITGASVAASGILLRTFWGQIPALTSRWAVCPLNGMQISFIGALSAISAYVLVSLFTRNPPEFKLERMLHRGQYDDKNEHKRAPTRTKWDRTLGITPDFTRGDRLIYYFNMGWAAVLLTVFLTGCAAYAVRPIPDWIWIRWWGFYVGFMVIMAIVTAVWFFLGGCRDLRSLLNRLLSAKVDEADDGRVQK
jgi:SSS family solute:Na+ symporter